MQHLFVMHKIPEECRFEAQPSFFHVEPSFSVPRYENRPLTLKQNCMVIVLGQSVAPA
jgi:hypothetical protein